MEAASAKEMMEGTTFIDREVRPCGFASGPKRADC